MVEETKESISSLFKQAQAYADNKEYNKANTILQKVIKLQPQNSYEWEKKGFAYNMLLKPREAIEGYQRALELEPDNTEYLKSIADIFSELKDHDSALENYEKIAGLEPNRGTLLVVKILVVKIFYFLTH